MVGRFAPSPTGPLHFGSLIAATASYLDARAAGGRWLVRMEDVDQTRARPGPAAGILRTLESFGFEWDGAVMVQSQRTDAYRDAFSRLVSQGLAYPCACSRKGEPHSGCCRKGLRLGQQARTWRVITASETIAFEDRLQGPQSQNVEEYCGDFVILRVDGLFAYQLAVVVDDRDQAVTDVVRGYDLLDSTPRQIYLQRLLGASQPRYLHTPIAVNALGQKLSKQTLAPAIDASAASKTIFDALVFLGQHPPSDLRNYAVKDIWSWAIAHWASDRIPRGPSGSAPAWFL